MYTPEVFREQRTDHLHAFIEAHSFATMIVADDDGGLEATHLPFLLDRAEGPQGRLLVHLARANPLWRKALVARRLLVVFTGPHGYISPRWYESPRRQVPTWNYAAVHAHGRAEGPLGPAELRQLLVDLVAASESGPEPWTLDQLDPATAGGLLEAIVGLSIPIERLEGKLKLSQNRSAQDQARVAAALEARGTPDDLGMLALLRQR
jgi:transcriptional regulator